MQALMSRLFHVGAARRTLFRGLLLAWLVFGLLPLSLLPPAPVSATAASPSPGSGRSTPLLNEPFTGTTAPDWVLTGTAVLTAGSEDPPGQGWLRLTNATNYLSSCAYYDKALPAGRGLLITFDYGSWGGTGADGLSFFLFDGSTKNFVEGAYGGSLGYAQTTIKDGASNGYLGLGLDEFGNYSNPTEGRSGGTGFLPQAVAIRGPGNARGGYAYLAGTGQLTEPPLELPSLDCPSSTCGSTRPAPAQYFRQVQIALAPVGAQYEVTAFMKFSTTGAWKTLFGPFTMPMAAPGSLKMGFAASTGSSTNYHEIRNLVVTQQVPDLTARMSVQNLTTGGGSAGPRDRLGYTVAFNNQSTSPITGVSFTNAIPANLTFVQGSASAGSGVVTFDPETKTLSVAAISVPASGQIQIAYELQANPDLGGAKVISNQGEYVFGGDTLKTDGDTATGGTQVTTINVTDGPNFDLASMTVAHDTQAIDAAGTLGEVLTYHVVLPNTGSAGATKVSFSDPLPANTAFITGTLTASDGAAKFDRGQNEITWSGDIAVGKPVTLDFAVAVDTGVKTNEVISNRGTVSANGVKVVTDADLDLPGKQPTEYLVGKVALISMVKTAEVAGGGRLKPGGKVTFRTTLSNPGASPVKGAVFVDAIPANTTYVSHTARTGKAVYSAPAVTVSDLDLNPGAETTIETVVQLKAGIPVTTTVIASQGVANWDAKGSGANDTSALTDGDPETAGTQPTYVEILAAGSAEDAGVPLVYTMGVTNSGPDTAMGVVVAVPSPAGIDSGICAATQGDYVSPSWQVGTLMSGATATLTITGTVTLHATTPITATSLLRCAGGLGPRSLGTTTANPTPYYRPRR